MKLNEIEATKGKAGNYYSIDEILGQEFDIVEDINQNSEIRTRKTKENYEYFLIGIRFTEEKDLSMRKAPLLAIAEALPRNESWQGYKLILNRAGTGAKIAYKATVKGKTLAKALEKPQDAQAPSQSANVQGTLEAIKMMAPNSDAALENIAALVSKSSPDAARFMIGMLKSSGRIMQNPAGVWVVI